MKKEDTFTDLWSNSCVRLSNMDSKEATVLIANSQKAFESGWRVGLKVGLEIAKDVMKREGYEFTFPNPEDIMLESDYDKKSNTEIPLTKSQNTNGEISQSQKAIDGFDNRYNEDKTGDSKSQTEQLHDAIGEELNKDYDAFQSGGDNGN